MYLGQNLLPVFASLIMRPSGDTVMRRYQDLSGHPEKEYVFTLRHPRLLLLRTTRRGWYSVGTCGLRTGSVELL